jgi:hypothetical protein
MELSWVVSRLSSVWWGVTYVLYARMYSGCVGNVYVVEYGRK